MATATRQRFTITLDPAVSRELSRAQRGSPSRSRSEIVEEAIRLWLRRHALDKLAQATEEYYRSITEEEKDEDRAWDELGGRAAATVWRRK